MQARTTPATKSDDTTAIAARLRLSATRLARQLRQEANAALTPPVRHILEQLDPYPACVINDRFDLLAFNQGYSTMMQGLDELPPEDRNVLWLAFTSERYRSCVGDIDEQSERLVAGFRASMANHLGERSWIELLERLRSAWSHRCRTA